MKRKIKLMIISAILLSVCLLNVNIKAQSALISSIELLEEQEMTNDVLYQYYKMKTSSNPAAAKVERDVFTYTLKQTEYAHLATWTYSSPDSYQNKTLVEIAKDYEKNHPGWVVLGGVNAEGYYNGELTNAFVQDGDVIRKDVSCEDFKRLIGFKDDGSHVIKQVPVSSPTPRLKVDGLSYDVPKINELPSNNDISIITKDVSGTLDVSGYSVVEATYSLFRKSTQFPDPRKTYSGSFYGIFLKGEANGVVNVSNLSANSCSNRKFYIVTKNQEVVNRLTSGKAIKCQFDYVDEFSDVTSMVGYMYRLVIDGKSIPTSYVETTEQGGSVPYNGSYCTTTSKERCAIGFKEDGSIILLTANTKKEGPTQIEVGEMLVEFGCKEAYQFDGGGSVTFLKRDQSGNLQMLNTPGDGSPRSIMSGLFIVARDPGLKVNNQKTTESSITFNKKNMDFINEATNISIKHNGNSIELNNDEIVIDGLEESKTYEFDVEYTLNGKSCKSKVSGKTKYYDPGIDINPLTNGFEVSLRKTSDDLRTSKVEIQTDSGNKYVIDNSDGTKTSFIIDDLLKGESYTLSYSYEVTILSSNDTYTRDVEGEVYKTLNFSLPTIKEFKCEERRGKLKVSFDINDVDKIISKITLIINGESIDVTDEVSYTIEDYDSTIDYSMKLMIYYLDDSDVERIYVGQEIVKEKTGSTPPIDDDNPTVPQPVETPKKKGCKKNTVLYLILLSTSLSSALLIFKKKK